MSSQVQATNEANASNTQANTQTAADRAERMRRYQEDHAARRSSEERQRQRARGARFEEIHREGNELLAEEEQRIAEGRNRDISPRDFREHWARRLQSCEEKQFWRILTTPRERLTSAECIRRDDFDDALNMILEAYED